MLRRVQLLRQFDAGLFPELRARCAFAHLEGGREDLRMVAVVVAVAPWLLFNTVGERQWLVKFFTHPMLRAGMVEFFG